MKLFTKAARLLTRSDFAALKGKSERRVGKVLCIDLRESPKGRSRIGITASGKFGSSCERNRFKRLAREAFRLSHSDWKPVDVHVVPRQRAKSASLADFMADFQSLVASYANGRPQS